MNKDIKKDLKGYIKNLKLSLNKNDPFVKGYIIKTKKQLKEFISNNDDSTIDDVYRVIGTVEELANNYDAADKNELYDLFKKFKKKVTIITMILLIIFVIIAIYLFIILHDLLGVVTVE